MSGEQPDGPRFDAVYKEAFPILYRVAYHLTHSEEIAEDMVQDAFLKYYNRVLPLPDEKQATYWLIRVTKNLCYNYLKRKGREAKANFKYYNEPKSDFRSSEEEIMREETSDIVKKALDKLPEKLRVVLILKEYSKLNYKEIGKALKISESNVKVRVFRARAMLEKIIEEEEVYVS